MRTAPGPREALRALLVLGAIAVSPAAWAQAPEVAGSVGLETRGFPYDSIPGVPGEATVSVVVRPELEWRWSDGDQQLRFVPFARLDQADDERTHFDIRELIWIRRDVTWEIAAGVGLVFWGATESQHLVDIINQSDLVENPDGEDKLGQPMINVTLVRDWGAINVFVLPGFRERTFPGPQGRFRPLPLVDTDAAVFESGAGDRHVDLAVRWSHFIGDWDVGAAHFHGTGREPILLPSAVGEGIGEDPGDAPDGGAMTTLVPFYPLIDQTSLDLTGAKGNVLWKLEAINRFGQQARYAALTGGFEYTVVGAFGRAWDVGLLCEYLWDERGSAATTPFQDDLFVGTRLALNDMQSTDLLAGVIIDRSTGASLINVEMSRRLGERYRLELEARFFLGAAPGDRMFAFQNDDYLALELSRFF